MGSDLLQRRRGLDSYGDIQSNSLEDLTTYNRSSRRRLHWSTYYWTFKTTASRWVSVMMIFFFVIFGAFLLFRNGTLSLKSTIHLGKLPPDTSLKDLRKGKLQFIHIVHTRFMQEQHGLEMLGMARLKLFETFCLPSMIQQSSQNFLWIIKTDPNFTNTNVFSTLIDLVKSKNNVYVISSNANFLFGSDGQKGSWGDGREGSDLMNSNIYTGDITALSDAIALYDQRLILETRLDADDGLHKEYIKYIQTIAIKRFQMLNDEKTSFKVKKGAIGANVPQWLYWCSRRHIEWHSLAGSSLSTKQKSNSGSDEMGYVNAIQHDKICVTPGITVGYFPTVIKDVPQYDHDKLYKNVRSSNECYYNKNASIGITTTTNEQMKDPCLELVEDLLFCSVRSRTWTSAGMDAVNLGEKNVLRGTGDLKKFTAKLWSLLMEKFGVNQTALAETQHFLFRNKELISYENLAGQCKSGHSCKDTAKQKLEHLAKVDKPRIMKNTRDFKPR